MAPPDDHAGPDDAPAPPLTADRVEAALGPRFAVEAGPAVPYREVWLDTADARVARRDAGLCVRSRPDGAVIRLVESTPAEATAPTGPTRPVPAPGWGDGPVRADDLPPGPLGDRARDWIGIRALLPLVEVTGATRELRVLDGERKTVVRLVLHAPARAVLLEDALPLRGLPAGAPPATLPARVLVEEVRGYRGPARAVAAALGAARIPHESERTAAEVFAAVGPSPEADPSSDAVDPLAPARLHVANALRDVLRELAATVPGTVADHDPEFLHDLRVAVRRSRSVLKLAGDTLPSGVAERFAPTLKWVGDLTTPVRDLDVHVLDFAHDAERLRTYEPADLEPLREHLVRHRAGERRALVRGLRSARFTRFLQAWSEALDAALAEPAGADEPGGRPVREVAAERIAHAHRRVLKLGRAIGPDSPAEDLHRLRKRAKELRYTLELFGAAVDPRAQRAVIKDLKALQDVLGRFQDSEVQRHALLELAEQLVAEQTAQRRVPVVTLLAMGELGTRLDEEQRRAREEFTDSFARFARPAARAHLEALTGGAGEPSGTGRSGTTVKGRRS